MALRIVIAGIGGQGVVFATKILSQVGMLRDATVLASENHGMSQRGGSVSSHVRIGAGDAPLIRRGGADALIGLDRAEAMRNLTFVRPGGAVFVSAAEGLDASLAPRLAELGVRVYAVDAKRIATEIGAPAAANLVVLGFAAAHADFGITISELEEAVRALGPAAAVERNLNALAAGAGARTATG
jgi:indolepyruvate ferredoxin oxidoreductase beta subunit